MLYYWGHSRSWFVLAEDLKYLRPDQERDRAFFVDKETGMELEVMETMEFIEWLVETDEQ